MRNKIPYLIIIILLAINLFTWSKYKDSENQSEQNAKALNDTIKYHKNKYGQEVASKLAIQTSFDNLKYENDTLKEAIKKFKKPITIIQTEQVVKIDTFYVSFKDSIKCVFSQDIIKANTYYSFSANVSNKGFKLNNLEVFNDQTIVTGFKKQGLFKKPLLVTEITNSNPHVKQTEIKPIVIVYPKKIYEKWYVTIPIGFVLGKLF